MTKFAKWRDRISEIQQHLSKTDILPQKTDQSPIYDMGSIEIRNMFSAYFQTVPNIIEQRGIDCLNAYSLFLKEHQEDLRNHFFEIGIDIDDYQDGKPSPGRFFCFLYEDLIIDFRPTSSEIAYLFYQTDIAKVNEIIDKFSAFFHKKESAMIHLLVNSRSGIDTRRLPLIKPRLDIVSNYNDDFLPIHEIISQRLNRRNDKGLVLLHGKPGTGKTSYVRFLATSLKKDIIFLPPDMASAITNPNLLSLLMDHRNSILVIEDAEKIIMDRDTNGHSPVSTLLNLADGLLSDCLNIQIICSFNTDLSKVDKALLRKGRLIAKYEFKELEIHKAQELSDKLGFKTTITEPMALTAIYNQEEQEFKQVSGMAPVGFSLGKAG